MDGDASFGGWLRQRRKQLDLTQARLAAQVGCAAETLRKIESGRLRPSREIASRLAECLDVPAAERDAFVQAARGSATPTLPRAAEPVRTRLPAPLTSLIGREDELAELRTLLANPACRLITIVGPGGIGKTRLVLAIAAEQAALFPDGAALVSLAAVSTPALVAPAILAALDVPLQGQRDPREQLIEMLRDKGLLLVLDNFEQLLCAEGDSGDVTIALLRDVLHAAPSVQLLVTSRERLRMQGEWLFDLGGLCYPLDEAGVGLTETAAMQLFVERARQVRPHPALTNDELRAAGRICRLVEGMPLAIELAAAALRVQSCIAIADSLQESLATLSADLRAVPERHHSIRATFEHSWRLLSERERHVFARLPVFRGGFDLEAATHVAQADALLLAALVDKSLLRWDGMGRYDMHELLRQYAGEKLREAEAVGQTQDRHLRFFLALAEDAAPRLHGAERVHWLERLDCEHDNLRAALEWAFDQHAAELGARLSGALWGFWDGCGYLTEGRSWLARALSECQNISVVSRERLLHGALCLAAYQGDTESALQLGAEALELCRLLDDLREHAQVQLDLGLARLNLIDHTLAKSELTESLTLCRSVSDARGVGRALNGLGLIAGFQGYLEQAEALHSEALAFAREVGDPNEIAQVLGAIARIAFERGNAVQAVVLVEESLAYFRELHDAVGRSYAIELLGLLKFVEGNLDHAEALLKESQKLAWSVGDRGKVADSLYWLGRLARVQGNYAWASQLYEESKAFHPETPNPLVLHQLGWLALMQGDWDRALSRFAESLSIYQNLGKVNFLACSLTGFATVAVAQGKLQQATVLLGAAHQLLVVMGVHLHPIDQQDVDRTLVSVQAQLSAEAFAAAWASGQAMTLEEAVAEAMTLTAETAAEEPSAGTE